MKSQLTVMFLFVASSLFSCKKDDVTPVNSSNASSRNFEVSYHIYSVSGNVLLSYTAPDGNKLSYKTEELNRLEETISFNWNASALFQAEATNTDPSSDEIILEILIDDKLVASSSANSAGGKAYVSFHVY